MSRLTRINTPSAFLRGKANAHALFLALAGCPERVLPPWQRHTATPCHVCGACRRHAVRHDLQPLHFASRLFVARKRHFVAGKMPLCVPKVPLSDMQVTIVPCMASIPTINLCLIMTRLNDTCVLACLHFRGTYIPFLWNIIAYIYIKKKGGKDRSVVIICIAI